MLVSKAETLVSLGIGRTFADFQILEIDWMTKETFKICVITGVSQDKTRQCFIWSLIQFYIYRLYPNNLKV